MRVGCAVMPFRLEDFGLSNKETFTRMQYHIYIGVAGGKHCTGLQGMEGLKSGL